jgi:excinuclease ABC subunit C
MAQKNAYLALERKFEINTCNQEVLEGLRHFLDLTKVPRWIECFDISHSCGHSVVASCIVFIDGLPVRQRYRRFKLSIQQNNDFFSMAEVVTRRYKQLKKINIGFPDLLLIDGGIGQLRIVESALISLNLLTLDLISIAKKEEFIFKSGSSEPLSIPKTSKELYLLQRIRDEAHRFAVSYHRNLRAKNMIQSELTQIPGIGPITARNLLAHYGSVRAIRQALHIDLKAKFGSSIADKITSWLSN